MKDHVVKRLSEQLADLSICANNVGDPVAAAEKEALYKIAARKEARSAAKMAVEKVNQQLFRRNPFDSLNSTRVPTRQRSFSCRRTGASNSCANKTVL